MQRLDRRSQRAGFADHYSRTTTRQQPLQFSDRPSPISPLCVPQHAAGKSSSSRRRFGRTGHIRILRPTHGNDDTVGEPGTLYLLEVNTQPGMTPTSLVPDMARQQGIGFPELVSWMVEHAACDS